MIFSVTEYFSIRVSLISSVKMAFAWINLRVYVLKLTDGSCGLKYSTSGILNYGTDDDAKLELFCDVDCLVFPWRPCGMCSKLINRKKYHLIIHRKAIDCNCSFLFFEYGLSVFFYFMDLD